jgi:hypothetical protein
MNESQYESLTKGRPFFVIKKKLMYKSNEYIPHTLDPCLFKDFVYYS